jgi:hypothetical protein
MKTDTKLKVYLTILVLSIAAASGPVISRLRDLSDVKLATAPTSGQALVWNGTQWTNGVASGGSATNAPVISQNGTNGGLALNFTDSASVTWAKSGSNWTVTVITGSSATNAASVTYVTNIFTTNITAITINNETNIFTVAKGGRLEVNNTVVTQYVRMPWTTLTMSGSNISSMDFAASSMFKVYATNNAFLTAPSNLPGTNVAQVVQLAFIQDGTGTRTLTTTNGSYEMSGSGFSTNQVIAVNTNANATTILTFVTSSKDAAKVEGVVAAIGQ